MGREWSELSALYLKTVIHVFDFVYTLSSANRPVSTKHGQNIYVQQNLNEFNHGPTGQNSCSYLLLNWEKLLHSTLFTL